jgi:hypothetical protein
MDQSLPPLAISLTKSEQELVSQIDFDFGNKPHGTVSWVPMAAAMDSLMQSLMVREAIPAPRWSLFTEPAYFVGGRGYSHYEMFLRNGTPAEAVFRHGNFVTFLRYFLYGPDLPTHVIAGFRRAVIAYGAFRDAIEIASHARRLTRTHGLNSDAAAEEFYKLALDCELDVEDAKSIRRSVMNLR